MLNQFLDHLPNQFTQGDQIGPSGHFQIQETKYGSKPYGQEELEK